MELFAREIASSLKPGDVVGLVGDLGAGKTTFVQYLAKVLGVKGRVNSPTFLVLRIYSTNAVNKDPNTTNKRKPASSKLQTTSLCLVHIDAYRLKDPRELEVFGAMEYIGAPGTVTVIEWADRVKSVLPKHTQWIHFIHGEEEGERMVRY